MLDFVGYGKSFLAYTVENPIKDLIFYFIIYGLIGWLVEGLYTVVTERRFATRSFFNMPIKPMYGFAPIILLECTNPNANIMFVAFLCFIIPSLVELISGLILKSLFNEKWWDYSDIGFNIGGHICLRFSLYWIVLCLLAIYIIHPMIYNLYKSVYFIWDNAYLLIFPYIIFNMLYVVINKLGRYNKLEVE